MGIVTELFAWWLVVGLLLLAFAGMPRPSNQAVDHAQGAALGMGVAIVAISLPMMFIAPELTHLRYTPSVNSTIP